MSWKFELTPKDLVLILGVILAIVGAWLVAPGLVVLAAGAGLIWISFVWKDSWFKKPVRTQWPEDEN